MEEKQIRGNVHSYMAVFDSAEEGGFNVSFPSFPGCVTFGENFEAAKTNAKEALELWIEDLLSRNERMPVAKARPIVEEIEVVVSAK